MKKYVTDKCILLSCLLSFSCGLEGDTQCSYIGLESRIVKQLYRHEKNYSFSYLCTVRYFMDKETGTDFFCS
jgi:hypothetical protein